MKIFTMSNVADKDGIQHFSAHKKKIFNYQFEKAIANKSIQLIKLLNVQSKKQSSPLKVTVKMQAGWKIILIFSLLLQMLTFSQLGLVTAIVCVQDLFFLFFGHHLSAKRWGMENKIRVMPIYLIYSTIETEMIEICNSLNIDEISIPLTHFKWMKAKIIT